MCEGVHEQRRYTKENKKCVLSILSFITTKTNPDTRPFHLPCVFVCVHCPFFFKL